MGGRKGQQKGKRGEREVKDAFLASMIRVEGALSIPEGDRLSNSVQRNTLQSDRGGYDIVGIPGLAVEVKRCETLSIGRWWTQTVAQAGKSELPVLIYRKSRKPWSVVTYGLLTHYDNVAVSARVEVSFKEFLTFFEHHYRQTLTSGHALCAA